MKVYTVTQEYPYEGLGQASVFSTFENAVDWLQKKYPQLHLRGEGAGSWVYDTGPKRHMEYWEIEEVDLDPT